MSSKDGENKRRPGSGDDTGGICIEARPEDMPPPEVPLRLQMDQDREALRLISWPSMRGRLVGEHRAFRKTYEKKIVSKDLMYHKRPEVPSGWPWSPPATIVYFNGKKRIGHRSGTTFVHKVGCE